ncbi:M48 family metallopeptidase [Sciscionella marina]|uniref:M48 metallopeptidase family protein n=1 Tax=Sciscionella marina TaxID=508770 RepID=UPI0003789A63|nr:M48 family metallopeptidase [Sciscionella marina]
MSEPRIEVRRSKRRVRTVSAYREGDKVVVLLPARMNKREELHWVNEMVSRLQRSEQRRRSPAGESDAALLARCQHLAKTYLDPALVPEAIRWVPPMRTRWASCTPSRRTIRVSNRLREAPGWVLDYVLVHELTHLKIAAHDDSFWEMVNRYPRAERAIGYLEGLAAAAGWPIDEEADTE